MAAVNKLAEVHSFVSKFTSLWSAGSNASLFFESNAGKAYVTLRFELGEHPMKLNDASGGMLKKRLSPSKLRRRERRAAERLFGETSRKVDTVEVEETEADLKTKKDVVIHAVTENINVNNMNGAEATQTLSKSSRGMKDVKDKVILANPVNEQRSLWASSHADLGPTNHVSRVNVEVHQNNRGYCEETLASKKCSPENQQSSFKSYSNICLPLPYIST